MLLNCVIRLLRVPWTARRSNQSILKESVLNIHWKDWFWNWRSNTLVTWYEELTHWKRFWCWERLKAGEDDDRGWDGWMVGWHHWLSGHKFVHAARDGEGQGSLAFYRLLGHRELDMSEQLKWTELNHSPLLKTPLYWRKKSFLFAFWTDKTGLIYLLVSWMSQF